MKLAGFLVLGVLFPTALSADETFSGEVLDFSAGWCQPCQQMSPIVERLKRGGMPIRKVDIEKYPSLTRGYRVQSIPTFVLVVNGQEVDRIVGATSEARLKGLIARIPRERPKSEATGTPAESATTDDSRTLLSKVNGLVRKRQPNQPSTPKSPAVVRAQSDEQQLKPHANPRMASSVRLRIRDGQGTSYGTGTLISSKPGRSIVVTCGHVFRGWSKASRLEVDVFAADGRTETFIGEPIDYDIKAEVGLLSINTSDVLPTARVASLEGMVQPKDRVFSVGCGQGNAPSIEFHEVTGIDRYQGFDNIECTGAPVQGRSGGGLFNNANEVIGTCIGFMDVGQGVKRGLYSGLRAIHRVLDRQSLTHLYRGVEPMDFDHQIAQPDASIRQTPTVASREDRRVSTAAFEPTAHLSKATQPSGTGAATIPARPFVTETAGANSPQVQAAIGVAMQAATDAEVVCVIRPRNGNGPSRVVIIDRASKRFVSFLDGELRNDAVQTTKRVPNPAAHAVGTSRATSSRRNEQPVATNAGIQSRTQPKSSTGAITTSGQLNSAPRRYVRSRPGVAHASSKP